MSTALPLTALALGALSSPHCVLMCGGACALLVPPTSDRPRSFARAAAFHFGRAATYAVMGALAGALGAFAAGPPGGASVLVLRGLAACGMLIAALSLSGLWSSRASIGRVKSMVDRLRSRASALGPMREWVLGAGWGFVPCGLVYAALVLALASSGAASGALTMGAFALGTMPALFAVHAFAARLARFAGDLRVRRFGAFALACAALINLSIAADGLRSALRSARGLDAPLDTASHCEPGVAPRP